MREFPYSLTATTTIITSATIWQSLTIIFLMTLTPLSYYFSIVRREYSCLCMCMVWQWSLTLEEWKGEEDEDYPHERKMKEERYRGRWRSSSIHDHGGVKMLTVLYVFSLSRYRIGVKSRLDAQTKVKMLNIRSAGWKMSGVWIENLSHQTTDTICRTDSWKRDRVEFQS